MLWTRLRRTFAALAMGALVFSAGCGACAIAQSPAAVRANPFLSASPLPFQAPPFDKIKDSDYQPAIEEGMKQQLVEIDQIAANPEAPTLENTIGAMERSGAELTRVSKVFFALTQANTNDTLQKIKAEEAPKLAAHHDTIYLNAKLFARVKAIYDQRASLKLSPEESTLLDVYYHAFVASGANLSDKDKQRLMEINKQLSTLETTYDEKLLAATKEGALVVDDKAKLKGLSDSEIAAAAKDAQDRGLTGKWEIPLQNTT